MIIPNNPGSLSPIVFSVITLIALIIYELGNDKIKKTMLPFVIILITVFLIIAGIKIYSMV